MNFDFSNVDELLKKAHDENLYKKLLAQLKKDFDLADIEIRISDSTDSKDLQTLIHEKIYYLILEKFNEYLHFLYVVDVPESAFKNIHMTDVVEVADQMTFLVLKREFQKVWYKKKFAS
jgi:hypothetical protein